MNESRLLSKLIEEDIININSLLIKNHSKLDITPNDIIVLSVLTRQQVKRDLSFSAETVRQKADISSKDCFDSLAKLEDKGYVVLYTKFNPKNGQNDEFFNLDGLYKEIVHIYQEAIREENEAKNQSFEEEISNLFERTFQRPLTVSDAEVIRNWAREAQYTIEEIKSEILDAAKMGKYSLKYVDSRLIKKHVQMNNNPEYQKTSTVIQELSEKWKK